MKKGVVVVLVFISFIFLSMGFAAAAETNDDKIEKAYDCLKNEIGNRSTLTLQEATFSAISVGWINKVKTTIENEKGNNCWPKSGCRLKDSAQVALAYDRVGKDNGPILNWIASQNMSSSDLNWFIEIDLTNHVTGSCTLKYGSESGTINIGNDMKLSGNAGSCLSISTSGYWLKLSSSSSCLDKEYTISCDKDFITTKLYQKGSDGTVYVSSETNSAAAGGTTTEKVVAKCLRTATTCDYEGTLWGALVLQRAGRDVSMLVPYLLTSAADNTKFLPSSFLYLITSRDDQFGDLIGSQKQKKFWEMTSSPYNKYYDSALALLALSGSSAGEKDATKEYFLTQQTPKGCWNSDNIRDTAFLLAAGWTRDALQGEVSGSGDTTNASTAAVSCENAGKYCEAPNACLEAGGIITYQNECQNSIADRCCSVKVSEQTCTQKNGKICAYNEQCSITEVPASDGSCCMESCNPIQNQQTEDQCSPAGGSCRISCLSGEGESIESCSSSSEKCCIADNNKTPSGGSSLWWIILLILLIALVIVAIVYREKIQIWFAKRKGDKDDKGPRYPPMSGGPRGPMPPPGRPLPPGVIMGPRGPVYAGRPMVRPGVPPARPQARAPTKPASEDKEMDDTMKKLREMSK